MTLKTAFAAGALALALACATTPDNGSATAPRGAATIKDNAAAAPPPADPIAAILTDSDRAIVPRSAPALDLALPPETGMPAPVGLADDGTVWPVLNQWNDAWEDRYSVWVAKALDEDFMVRHHQWSDCADFPYVARFIFARMNYLPQGCHSRFGGEPLGQWSKDFSGLPRGGAWDADPRFLRMLDEVKSTVQCRSMPFDTHPIAILPEYGFLRPGAVATNEMHSLVITRVDRRDFFPIWMTASTLPPTVRKLTFEALNDGMEFSSMQDYGFVNFNWWVQDPATHAWTTVADEKMPGWSTQQYRLMLVAPKLGELRLAGLLQKLYAYHAKDGDAGFKELSADLLSVLNLRQIVVTQGIENYRNDPGAKGDLLSVEYDEYSTHGRDSRLRVKFANLHKLVELKLLTENDLYRRLSAVEFNIAPDQAMSLLELDFALRHGGISPEPWDTLWQRWGAGDSRMLAEIVLDRKYASHTQPAPDGGLFAETASGAVSRLDANGKEIWNISGSDDCGAAVDAKAGLVFKCDTRGALRAYEIASGRERWHADPVSATPVKIAAMPDAGIVALVTARGAAAYAVADGAPRWKTADAGFIVKAAAGPAGPLATITRDGQIGIIATDGSRAARSLGIRALAPPLVDAAGNVYALGENGDVVALDLRGAERWRRNAGGRLAFPSALGPDGALYLAAGSMVVCMAPDGATRWTCPVENEIYAAPAVAADGMVYVTTLNDMMRAIGPDGRVRWSFDAGANLLTTPIPGPDGRVWLVAANGRMFIVKAR